MDLSIFVIRHAYTPLFQRDINIASYSGVMILPVELLTEQGYDLQFGTNVLGHFYLTKLLLPALLSGAKSSSEGKVCIVSTTSVGHVFGSLDFNTFKDSPKRRKTWSFTLYGQSKFDNVVFAKELVRRYGDRGIVSTSIHPCIIRTELTRHVGSLVEFLTICRLQFSAAHGALTQLYAGTIAADAELNGKYLVPFAHLGEAAPTTDDPELGQQLWKWSEEQVANL